MKITDYLKPQHFRFLLVALAVALLGRAIHYLLLEKPKPLAYFSIGDSQEILSQSLGLTVPMVIMTILWPIVFAFLNLLHKEIKLAAWLFHSVIAIHVASCLCAAGMIVFSSELYIFGSEEELSKMSVIFGVVILTVVTGIISTYLYHKNVNIFASSE